jgi:hypothetical protein
VHCSIWRFTGDPAALERGYAALMDELGAASQRFHAAARTPDGLLLFDTCPSRAAFEGFFGSREVRVLFERHGLADPVVEDFPVLRAYANGLRVDEPSA